MAIGTHEATPNHESEKPRLLIYGINYWPEITGIAPYTSGLAQYLAAKGWRVSVCTGMPHYPQWEVHQAYRRRLRATETIDGVNVWRVRHSVPSQQSAIRRGLYEVSYLAHSSVLRLPRPDVVLGIVPSLGGGVRAVQTARRYKAPCGILFQDLMGNAVQQSGIAGGQRAAGATRAVEGWMARRADGIAIVAEGFRPYIEGLGASPDSIQHVPNWSHVTPPQLPRAETRELLGWSEDAFVVLHAGNMGLKQGLEHVIAAAKSTSTARYRFVLMGDGSQRQMLEVLAADCLNVTFLDPQPEDRFVEILAAADVLLVHERMSVVNMSLPSKLTSYFVAGRPVLAAGPPNGATALEVDHSGAGITVRSEDPTALLGALDRLSQDKDLRDQLIASGPRYAASHLSSRASLERMERLLERLMEPRKLSETSTSSCPKV